MTSSEIQQAFDIATRHHRAGRLGEAERSYREILAFEPRRDEVMAALSQILFISGRSAGAAELLRSAVAIKPGAVEYRANLGMVLSALGRFDEAIEVFRGALAIRNDSAEVWNNLGNALKEKNLPIEAEQAFKRAVTLKPGYAAAQSNLGIVLQEQEKLDEAIGAFELAVGLRPDNPKALSNLGNALLKKERFAEATAAYRRALERDSGFADARFGLGTALFRQGLVQDATAEYRAAIAARPDYAEAYYNLGRAAQDLGQPESATEYYRRAVELRPDYVDAVNNYASMLHESERWEDAEAVLREGLRHQPNIAQMYNNLGAALQALTRLDDAEAAYRRAVELRPDYDHALLRLSLVLLLTGRLKEAWPAFEARRRTQRVSYVDPFPQPVWKGEELDGRTILLHAEQGFGDTLQFIRYAPMVKSRGGRVLVLCPRSLHRLIDRRLGIDGLLGGGDAVPAFDVQCSLVSLPGVFESSIETIPADVPYLSARKAEVERWRERLGREPGRLKVGLAWAGNPEHANDRNRSMPLAALAPLAKVKDFAFVSLQKGPAAEDAKTPPPGMKLIDWTAELDDFADTAALIAALDLVISVDTSVVHLSGAMGRPVWVMLPEPGDWRWMMKRSDSPWYPTARLFRQPARGDWEGCIGRVAEALADWAMRKELRK